MRRALGGMVVASALAWWAPPARAQDCGDLSTQSAMNECAATAFRRADAALNDAYREVAARLKPAPESARQLVAAQKAWLAFRDVECGFETALTEGGSIRPFLQAECQGGLTRARTAEFQAWLRCQEGDLSCPLPPR